MARLKRFLKRCLFVGFGFFAVVVVLVIAFVIKGNAAQSNFRPVQDPIPREVKALIDEIKDYARPEESTYLTFPEWYLVFNPQEYGAFIAKNNPSSFPYFRSIAQFWSSYSEVYGITKKHYPFNAGNHLMEVVIGTSFTIEYLIKGIWENTIGRVTEWFSSGEQTEEDAYAIKVAQDYGNFIPTHPWYEFPYGERFTGLWKETNFFGRNLIRKWERKIFLSIEYGVKTGYAKLIMTASHGVYGIADNRIYASVRNAPDEIFKNPGVVKIQQWGDRKFIVTVPHYQGFTDMVPQLAQQGVDFVDFAGNDEILLTVIAPVDWQYDLKGGSALFTMEIMTDPNLKRVAVQAPAKSLGSMLREFAAQGIRIEHLYDY